MIILGVALIILGLVTGLGLLLWIGIVLALVGLFVNVAGGGWGVPAGGRRRYYW